MAASSSQAKPKPACRYGLLCERKNTEHLRNFSHPPSVGFQADESNLQRQNLRLFSEEQQLLNDDPVHPHLMVPVASNSSRVLLMLVGLPGSGKSTFCNKLVQNNPSKWRRICQDTISNGKRGTKEQCLKAAEKALYQGLNVMIDRCNLTKDQRHEFLQLSRRVCAQAHALVLDLLVKTCIQRAIQRTGHEGGLEGKRAPAAVQRMAQQKENPLELEGFSLIVACCTEVEVERAFNMYQDFNEMGNQGVSGKSDETSSRVGNGAKVCVSKINNQGDSEKSYKESVSRVENEAKMCDTKINLGECIDEGLRTLAFPSISTSDFQFDHERAADIIVEVAGDFLHKFRSFGLRLAFVDLKEDSDMLVRVRRKATIRGLRSEEFMTIAGDITKLRSSSRLRCNFIANATNWRLKPGGGGVNAAVFKAAGEGLEIETKKRAKTLNPGSALVVPLPSTSPMHVNEGVTHVIQVLGPNMNPERPNCLQGDYVEGSKLLRDAYACMFNAFASHVEALSDKPINQRAISDKRESPRNAFTVLMQSAKHNLVAADSDRKAKHHRQFTGQEDVDVSFKHRLPKETVNGSNFQEVHHPRSNDFFLSSQDNPGFCMDVAQGSSLISSIEASKSKHWEPWAEALWKMALHPEHHKDKILQVTDQAIVISDKFPKGRRHFIVISRLDGLDSIVELTRSHLTLLHDMHGLGMTLVQSSLQQDDSLVFRLGYHSEPSMRQLHMHVISQDFDSPALKNKKHWNSFTTAFFRDSKGVIEELTDTGQVKPVGDENSLLKMELRCHRCRSAQPNIPRLKQHIHSCTIPFPTDLVQKGYLVMTKKESS